jgi:hypothetical protein
LPVSTEKYLKYETFQDAIFIRAPSGGFWLFDKGIRVENIETISTNGSLNGSYGYYVLRSKKTGRRYWIDKSTYLYGSYYKINGVYSE